MQVVSGIPSSGYWGSAGWAVERGDINQDTIAGRISLMEVCEHLGWRVALSAKYFAAGKEALGEDDLQFTKE